MSQIDELINEHCLNGVEFRELCELGHRNKGTPITAAQMKALRDENGTIRIFAGGQTMADVAEESVPEKDVVRVPSIIVKSRGHIGFTYYDRPFSHKSELWSYSIECDDVVQKFVYYYLVTQVHRLQKLARATSVKIPQLSVRDTDAIRVPLPPIELQQKIVDLLDTYTKLEQDLKAELEAELEARTRQYVHYRDALLTFADRDLSYEVAFLTLNDVCTSITAGGDLPKKHRKGQSESNSEFPYPIYSNGSHERALYGFSDSFKIDERAVTISARGTIGFHAVRDAYFTPIVRLVTLIPKPGTLLPEFLNYVLDVTDISKTGGSIPQLTVPHVKKLVIPIPPLEIQQEIVSILDKFNALVNDLSIGLPAEINARRKQYEYYRDRLLTFKEAA